MTARARTIPRKSPNQERSKATVDAILAATARILVKEGYDRASTNKIAAAAGVSVGSLYQYFPSKEALVAALIERHSNEMMAMIESQAIRLMNEPIEVAVRETLRTFILAHRIDPKLHAVIIEQVPRIGRLQRIEDVECRSLELVHAYLQLHRDEIKPKNLEIAAFMVTQVMEALTHGTVLRQPKYLSDDALVDESTNLILGYLLGR